MPSPRTARLLVLGSSRHGAAHRATAGTLAGRLLHGAPCPVAVVPAGWSARADREPARIVCGFETGPEGEQALAAAEDLARRAHLPLELVKAAPTGVVAAAEWPMYTLPSLAGQNAFEVARNQLRAPPTDIDAVVDVHSEPLVGDAAQRLREHAAPTTCSCSARAATARSRACCSARSPRTWSPTARARSSSLPRRPGADLSEHSIASTAAATGSV